MPRLFYLPLVEPGVSLSPKAVKRKRTEQDVLCPQKYGSKNRKEFYFLNYSAWLETALDSSEVLLSEEVLLETEEVSSASEETLLSEEAVEVP